MELGLRAESEEGSSGNVIGDREIFLPSLCRGCSSSRWVDLKKVWFNSREKAFFLREARSFFEVCSA